MEKIQIKKEKKIREQLKNNLHKISKESRCFVLKGGRNESK